MWVDPAGDVPSLGFTLLPLSVELAAEIVAIATDQQPLRPHDLEELAQRSGGSPLFLFELLDLARATGTTDSLPDSVEAVVAAEIDRSFSVRPNGAAVRLSWAFGSTVSYSPQRSRTGST